QILKACSNKDFIAALKSSVDLEKRTCNVVVDSFALDFQRIGKGRWFNQSRPSALLCNILKVYELRGEESEWTLTETRLSGDTEGACEVIKNEIGKTTVWTSNKLRNTYELPCDFVVHKLFRFPDEKFRYIPTQ
ncbi:MAG TPA: hypothetical protein VGH22_22245, partial [Candidatus Binatia bacterium]